MSPLQVRKVIDEFKVGAPARVGLVAPNDVTIPGGNTGMDPSQTSFFQVRGAEGSREGAGAGPGGWAGDVGGAVKRDWRFRRGGWVGAGLWELRAAMELLGRAMPGPPCPSMSQRRRRAAEHSRQISH